MTERLYYEDPLLFEFEAVVTSVRERNGQSECTLDRSAFYPTSGGQPFDTGTLTDDAGAQYRVTDVNTDGTGEVWHSLDRPVRNGLRVTGRIDRARRLDHMEQHGGEHLLANAVYTLYGGVTRGLHTGHEDASIDVKMPDGSMTLSQGRIAALEETVNRRIRADDEVRCWFPEPGDLAALPLRKPPTVAEHVRIVQYGDYEYCPCGGTHPPRTGMIGLFKILSAQPSKGFARIRFVCGGRAVKLLDTLYEKARQAGALLSCSYEDVPEILSLHIRQEEAQRHLLIDTVCGSAALQAENARAQGKNFALGMLPAGLEKTLSQAGAAMLEKGLETVLCCAPREKGGFVCMLLTKRQDADMRALAKEAGIRGGGSQDCVQGMLPDEAALEKATETIGRTTPNRIQ